MPTRNGSCIEAMESAAERTVPPMVLVLMGVSGSGKSTVAVELHRVLGWPFQEGDDLHPSSNVEKMRSGHPLDDAHCVHPPVCGTRPGGTDRFNRLLGARHRYRRTTAPEVGKKTQRRREQD